MQPQAPNEPNVAACPLLTAILPLRYAIGPSEPALDVSAYDLPKLQGSFPDLGPRLKPQPEEGRSLNYTARLLRDGWLYVWHKDALAEYRVERAQLSQTDRGGRAIDTRSKPYLICFAGHSASLVWSPIQWSDTQFRSARERADVRQRIMRDVMPGAVPFSGQVAGFKPSIADYHEPEYYDWTDAEHHLPDWPKLLKNMRECEQQAYAIIDDAWGVQLDLAKLIRLSQQAFQDIRQLHGEDWHLAGLIRSIADSDPKTARNLPSMTDHPRLESLWAEQDQAEDRHAKALRQLGQLWAEWFATLRGPRGPQTLESACGHFDIVQEAARDDLQAHFAGACLGPAATSLGLKAIVNDLGSESEDAKPWFLWAVLGVTRRIGPAEINSLLGVLDGLMSDGATLLKEIPRWVTAMNQAAEKLLAYSTRQLSDAGRVLLDALAPVFALGAPTARQLARANALAAQRYFAAALARGHQRLALAGVSQRQFGEWLSDTMGTRLPPSHPRHMPSGLSGQVSNANRLLFLYPVPASAAANLPTIPPQLAENQPLKRLFDLDNLKSAQLKIVLVGTAGVNLWFASEVFFKDRSVRNRVGAFGALFGTGTAISAVFQKIAESDWEKTVARSGSQSGPAVKTLAFALGAAAVTAGLLAATCAFDVLLYGWSALEAYQEGDYASAGVRAGQSVLSAALVANSIQLSRALWAARLSVLKLAEEVLKTGLLPAPHPVAKGAALTLLVISGIFLDWYVQHSPLEAWLKQNRFGRNPADWAQDHAATLDRLYSILYPINLSLHRLNETHPYTGDTISAVYLILSAGGHFLDEGAQVEFQGTEAWEIMLGGGDFQRRPVMLTQRDFTRCLNTEFHWQINKPVYRRVYHREPDGRTLAAVNGVLHYSPMPGLVLPPVDVEDRLWI